MDLWNRQEGKCHYCGLTMLPDQAVEIVEIELGKGNEASNLAYVHQRCVYGEHEEHTAPVELLPILENVLEEKRNGRADLEDPYYELREFFRLTDKTPVTLTFAEIEDMIGCTLPSEAYRYENFWFDENPFFRRGRNQEFPISESWLSQGYKIKWLRLPERKVVFRQEVKNLSGLAIPPQFYSQRLPAEAVEELDKFFKKVIQKYGL